MVRLLITIVAIYAVSGCATMNKNECKMADWRAIGYEDGAKGRTLSYLGNHRKACSEHGIAPDMDSYEKGRLEGVVEYCQPGNGFKLGKAGTQLNRICAPHLMADFESAWLRGNEIYKASSRLRASERALRRNQQEISSIQKKIKKAEEELVSDGVSSQKRKDLLVKVKELNADLEDADYSQSDLENRVTAERIHLEQIKASNEY